MRSKTVRGGVLVLACSLGGCGQTTLPLDHGLDLGERCAVPARPNATIGGTTPSGLFAGQFAWVGYRYGPYQASAILRVTESADPQSPSSPYLVATWQSAPVIGEQAVAVTLVDGGVQLNAAGRVTLTEAEPAGSTARIRLAGMLTVHERGGKLTLMGDFSAARCPLIDESYP